MTNRPEPPPIIKGSWEDLLDQAEQLFDQQNDAAIPIFEKVVNGLCRLSAHQRLAADRRLQALLIDAALELQQYLCFRDRYAEALAVNEQVRVLLPEDFQHDFKRQAAAIRLQAGEVDTALAELHAMAADEENGDWGDLLFAALRVRQFAAAQSAVEAAERWVEKTYGGEKQVQKQDQERDRDAAIERAYVAFLRARLAVGQGQPGEALRWFGQAVQLDPDYGDNPQSIYIPLINAGAYAEALTLIRLDHHLPNRAAFWQGVALWRTGKVAEAEQQWRKAVKAEAPAANSVNYAELVLAHYYLGDHEGTGLASVLHAVRQGVQTEENFYLAGLGWALRNDMAAAHIDLQMAQMRHKSLAEGRKLGHDLWQLCTDLLDESKQKQLLGYFEDAQIQRRT